MPRANNGPGQPAQQPAAVADARKFTITPNVIYDYWLGELDPPEFCVLAYLVRHTFGWHRAGDDISYRQFAGGKMDKAGDQVDRGCGLTNPTAIKRALDRLCREGLVERTAGRREDGGQATSHYRLVVHEPPEADDQGDGPLWDPYTPGVKGYTPGVNPPLRPALHPLYAGRIGPYTPGVKPIKEIKERSKEKLKKVCGAAEPHRAHAALEMVPTQDDEQAPAARRLALRLAGDVLDCGAVPGRRLARYEAFCAGLLEAGWSVEDLCTWMDWMASGTCFWAGKSRKWTETAMLADLENWDGDGRPSEKEDDGG